MTRGRTCVLLVVILLFAFGSPAMVGGQPGVPIDPNPFLALLPALRTAPAPGWVKLGTRITYESAAASFPGRVNCHEKSPGDWHTPRARRPLAGA